MESSTPKYAAETPRLWLQTVSIEEHLEGYHAIYSNPEALKWSSQPLRTTLASSREGLTARLRSPSQPWIECYAILLRPEHDAAPLPDGKARLIGFVGTIRQIGKEGEEKVPDMGYRLHPDFYGKGYMTEAVRGFVVLYWTLEDRKDIKRISAMVDVRNTASGRVMEKIGARKGEIVIIEHDRLGRCEIESWLIDRP